MKIILFILLSSHLFSKVPDSLNTNRLIGVSAASAGGFAVSQVIQYEQYWGERSNFRIMDWQTEYDDALLADKFGHYFASYAISKNYAKLLEWTGMSEKNRVWTGAGVSLFHQTYVEINDGFSEGDVFLGFSIGDMLANIAGAGFPVLQYYYPKLEAINFKISYRKSENFDKIGYDNVINDYESTYHWVSVNPIELLDIETKYWDILAISIGHSVKNIDRYGAGNHEFYIGLDVNWKHFYKYELIKNSYYLQLIIELLDKYKFPLPAIRISPQLKFYGFER